MPGFRLPHCLVTCVMLTGVFVVSGAQANDNVMRKARLNNATMAFDDRTLTVSTGAIERVWRWTGHGLTTVRVTDKTTGRTWAGNPKVGADWAYPGFIDPEAEGTLVSLTAKPGTDDGFTSEHLAVTAEIEYPTSEAAVRYEIWAYPDAPGLRTQIFLRRLTQSHTPGVAQVEQPTIRVVRGQGHTAHGSAKVAGEAKASNLHHPQAVQLHVLGLDTQRDHVLGVSWWDWGGGGREQRVRVTSVDGETAHTVIPKTTLPAWKGKQQMPVELTAKVPGDVLLDNTFRVSVDKISGHNANVSEIWLYASGKAEEAAEPLEGPADRLAQLSAQAPAGTHLAAYLDCGSGTNTNDKKNQPTGRVDFLPITTGSGDRHYIGYFNDLQNRNKPGLPVLREEVRRSDISKPEVINWANIVSIEDRNQGILLVKESHKCANQAGVDTGEFVIDDDGLHNTGTALPLSEITDEFRWCWASWCVVYSGGDLGRQLAIKRFDRVRYPQDLALDMNMFTVIWYDSSDDQTRWHRGGNWQDEVLAEMRANNALGIDCVIIDDGWFHGADKSKWDRTWRPHPEPWPSGWKPAVNLKHELNMKLGLWAIAQQTPVEDLLWNWEQLKMIIFKLDFANLRNRTHLDDMIRKGRTFVAGTGHTCNVLWDNTEILPRFGYYWLRDVGVLHGMNRKHLTPAKVTYVPWITFRDIWLLGKYQNLNQLLLTACIPSRVNPETSDAKYHGADYCLATTMMGIPHIQASVRDYSDEEVAQLKRLIPIYKQHREAIYTGYVVPIGEEPSNKSWAGFQALTKEKNVGYLMLFRERLNESPTGKLRLNALDNAALKLTNLLSGKSRSITVSRNGEAEFTIPEAPGFLFLRYEPR